MISFQSDHRDLHVFVVNTVVFIYGFCVAWDTMLNLFGPQFLFFKMANLVGLLED